eukprot:167401_1
MIYTILSLFAYYELSTASRRLLQSVQPEFVPVATPSTSTQPAVTVPAATVPAATVPAATNPGNGGRVTLPFDLTIPTPHAAAPPHLNCDLPYTAAGSCAGKIHSITNAREGFTVNCLATGSCTQSEIVLNYLPGGPFIEAIEAVNFVAPWSGYKTTLTIDNQQGTNKVVLERLTCAQATSCNGLTVVLINGHLNDMDCNNPDECADCWVKQGPLDPKPKACYGW